jgi:hypothetical protein
MSFDPLAALREAGSPIDQLSEAQRAVLSSLGEHEVAVLVSVQQRLREAQDGDLEGHDMKML